MHDQNSIIEFKTYSTISRFLHPASELSFRSEVDWEGSIWIMTDLTTLQKTQKSQVLAVIKFNFHDANHKSRVCSPLWLLVFSEYFSELDFVVCCISLFDKLLWFSLSRVNQVFWETILILHGITDFKANDSLGIQFMFFHVLLY